MTPQSAAPPDPPAPAPRPPQEIGERTAAYLFSGLIIFTMLTIATAIALPNNERLFTFLAATAGNFAGALFLRLKG